MGVREEGLTKFMINHGSQNFRANHFIIIIIIIIIIILSLLMMFFLLYRGSNFSQNLILLFFIIDIQRMFLLKKIYDKKL
jgi:hypothetical protein